MRELREGLVAALLLASGCSGGGRIPGSGPIVPVRRDSAGVSFVEYPADALARTAAITMDSVPSAIIGDSDVQHDVTHVRFLVFLSDGRVAGFDADRTRRALRIFDTTGAEVGTFGRAGAGPGEFENAAGLAWGPGDTLAVSDWSLSRITLFQPTIGFVRDQPGLLLNGGAGYVAGGRLRDGSWLLSPASWAITGSGAHGIGAPPPPVPFGRLAVDAPRDQFDTLGFVPGLETAYVNKEKTGVAMPRFSTPSMVIGWQGEAAVITGRAWRVERVDARGRLTTVITIRAPLRNVTSTMIDSAISATVRARLFSGSTKPEAGAEEKLRAELREWPSRDSLPPFGPVRAGPDGVLWLPDYPAPGEPRVRITALGPDGALLGRLAVPSDAQIEAFGPARLLLRTTDENGIVRFEIHRLRMPP